MNFFPNVQRMNTLTKGKKKKKKLFCFVWRKQIDDFPSCRVMIKAYRKTQLSSQPKRHWSWCMSFYLSKDFPKTSGLPSSRPTPSPQGSCCRRSRDHFQDSFCDLEPRQICAVNFCPSVSEVPREMNYTVRSCLFALRRQQTSLFSGRVLGLVCNMLWGMC